MISLNTQPVEKRITRDDGALDVVEVFPTLQGEGPYAGRPAVFVRLAGCNLQCPACDTDYTSERELLSVKELMESVNELVLECQARLIVLTGGEPLRQACGEFVKAAFSEGGGDWDVQIETNGTLWDESLERIWYSYNPCRLTIVCCPKTAKINPTLAPRVDHYKYVIRAGEVDYSDGLPTSSLLAGVIPARPHKGFSGNIYVQPCDEQDEARNKLNTAAAVDSCMKHGYTLCLQLHKIVGLP